MATPKLITVTAVCTGPDDEPAAGGTITFTTTAMPAHGATGAVMIPKPIVGTSDAAGLISIEVPANDDPAWDAFTWVLAVRFPDFARTYPVTVPYASPGDTITLGELTPQPADADLQLYATLAQLQAYVDPDELAAELAGYTTPAALATALSAYTTTAGLAAYATDAELTAALSVMASDAELAVALAGYLADVGPATFVGNLLIAAVNGLKGYGFRTDGSNVNLDAFGAALFIAVHSGAGIGLGTERVYLRLESGVQLAHAIGRWIVAADPDTGVASFDSDPAAGWTKLGSKNRASGATAITFAAKSPTTGWPTTGTWALGDVLLCNDGWYECTTAGTPGAGTKRG